MSPGPRLTSVPSGTLIHPTVSARYTNVTDSTDGTTVPYRSDLKVAPKLADLNNFSILCNMLRKFERRLDSVDFILMSLFSILQLKCTDGTENENLSCISHDLPCIALKLKRAQLAEMGDHARASGPKSRVAAVPLSVGSWVPMWQCRLSRGLPPYQVASWSIQSLAKIHQRYRQDRQTGRRSDSTGWQGQRFYRTVAPKHLCLIFLGFCAPKTTVLRSFLTVMQKRKWTYETPCKMYRGPPLDALLSLTVR